MKNTWIQTAEVRNVNERMDNEDARLAYYYLTDTDKFNDRIKEIAQVTIDEFWRPEAFIGSCDEYNQHMMHYKKLLAVAIPRQVTERFYANYPHDCPENSFEIIMLAILSDIEFYNSIYTDLFHGDLRVDGQESDLRCECPACQRLRSPGQ